MPTLTLIDALRIQDFVFASNRLRDVVVGSALVAKAAGSDLLKEIAGKSGRLIYAAGGNALLHFENESDARSFVGRYSRCLIDDYPGLDVEAAHVTFNSGGMYEAFKQAREDLRSRKLARHGNAATLGLGVTAECVQTRGVATYRTKREGERGGEVALSEATGKRRLEAIIALESDPKITLASFPGIEFRFPRNHPSA